MTVGSCDKRPNFMAKHMSNITMRSGLLAPSTEGKGKLRTPKTKEHPLRGPGGKSSRLGRETMRLDQPWGRGSQTAHRSPNLMPESDSPLVKLYKRRG